MKSRQFCSVCKQWLDMEVVPTGDGDDDGVVWFRCPQCQGFLPKLSSALAGDGEAGAGAAAAVAAGAADGDGPAGEDGFDLEAGLAAAAAGDGDVDDPEGGDDDDDDAETDDDAGQADDGSPSSVGTGPVAHAEPVHEYAAMLAAVDPADAVPYRPWATYEVGQCILHLAWNDCGVVVDRETLPGGRRVIKCWFQGAGVVRLIENAPR